MKTSKYVRLIVSAACASALLMSVPSIAQTTTDTQGQAQTQKPTQATPSAKAQRAKDHNLRKAVRHALVKTQRLDQSHIVIVAKSGHVTLEGSAPDNDQIQLAAAAVSNVPGVVGVTNALRVEEPGR